MGAINYRAEGGDDSMQFDAIRHVSLFANRCFSLRLTGTSFAVLRTALFIALFTSAVLIAAGPPSTAQNLGEDDIDRSVKPGDDFYRYANGVWLKTVTIPAGQTSRDTRAIVNEKTSQRVRELIQEAATTRSTKGSIAQKVGDYYATFMDEDGMDAKGLTPLADEMAAISAINNKTSLSTYLGTTLNGEVDGLTTNADHIFGLWINQGFEDADHNVVHLWQGGLGMLDRDNYIDPSPKVAALRARYQTHIAAVLKLAGVPEAEMRAARILSLEIQIARAFAPNADAADVFKQNNPWKRADFDVKAPGMDWAAYFKSAGLERQTDFIVWQPSAVIGVAALVASESTDLWRDYLTFHLVDHYASVLTKAVAAEHFGFYGTVLSGMQQAPDRTKSAIAATNGALGQAVGQLYTQRYFPAEAKAKAQAMAGNLIAAYRARISNLTWMSLAPRRRRWPSWQRLKSTSAIPTTGSTIRRLMSCGATLSATCAEQKVSCGRETSSS
jgi:predicted metalloendopeptidase